jgi:hypothetical protein
MLLWGIYAPQEVPLGGKGACLLVPTRGICKGRLPLFVRKLNFTGCGGLVWFRRGRFEN